jgi:hypothetical protein
VSVGFALPVAVGIATMVLAGCESPGTEPDPPPAQGSDTSPARQPDIPPTTPTKQATVFDEAIVQDSVHRVLTDDYGIDGVDVVICPAGQEVEVGAEFACTARIAGERKRIPITVETEQGRYEVGLPE